MATRVSYPVEVKMKAIEMKLAGISNKQVLEELCIRNVSQIKTWMKWYREGEMYRLQQPVGKQYTYGKGPEYGSETAKLQAENRYLRQQVDILKKYRELERMWSQK
ncbi:MULTISPECIES: hypothetical protein [Sporosarcina]|uniref:Transposase n=1 Tax=Sporosarcina contaminans TaxID=633403 RepID=A0ABW3U246_9BACL